MILVRVRLKLLLRSLSKDGFLPSKVEIVPCAGSFFVNISDEDPNPIISDRVVTGFSRSADVAFLKAISELVEKRAFVSGRQNGVAACQTERSDGFAAYPRRLMFDHVAQREARTRALDEAIERFVWASWWDEPMFSHEVRSLDSDLSKFPVAASLLSALSTPFPVVSMKMVIPAFDHADRELMILVCEMENGGFFSGGACGERSKRAETLSRAAAELFRHGLALKRFFDLKRKPEGFYQERLAYFGFGDGRERVLERLTSQGTRLVKLPTLVVDQLIPHAQGKSFFVHRCFFAGQPPFVGGALERFCL